MPEETNQTVEDVMSGNITARIQQNMRYAASGFVVGAFVGVIIAVIAGKCRICYGLAGALAGGGTGFLISRKQKESK